MELKDYLEKIVNKQDLDLKESENLVDDLTKEGTDPLMISAILAALRTKGETVNEITGFIKGMQKKMNPVTEVKEAIDIVGTGGDGFGTFNISTVSALVAAGAGVKVAKHGNRAASSRCGSADVLEELGVNLNLEPKKAHDVLEKTGMVFLFAPYFHPAMKQVGPIRKALKIKTIFNYLGPFLNPTKVKRQLLGVPNEEVALKMAEVAMKLDYDYLLIIYSDDGLDEISLSADTQAIEIKKGKLNKFTIHPEHHKFKKISMDKILGGDAKENAAIIKRILAGEKGEYREMVLINSAFALLVSGKVENIAEGIKLAKLSIDSGKAKKVLDSLVKETNL